MKNTNTILFRKVLPKVLVVIGVALPWVFTKLSSASYSHEELRTHISIEGIDYGYFDSIGNLNQIEQEGYTGSYKKITLARDFVTDPSLYVWAQNTMKERAELKDVMVTIETREGEPLSRFVLKYVQPLTWTVEAANPALGGFHEKIELAVQEIAVR